MSTRDASLEQDVLQALETPAKLRAWLEGHLPDAWVGTAVSSEHCPLANFLQEEARVLVKVDRRHITSLDGATQVATPRWGDRFITLLDRNALLDRRGRQQVTAKVALGCLETAQTLAK